MEDTFKESVVEKISQVEKQIQSLSGQAVKSEEIRHQQNALSAEIDNFKAVVSELNQNVKILPALAGRINELSPKLERCTKILSNPPDREEHHIHHFRWPLGVAVAVFLLLTLAVSRLYFNHQKLQQYIANDTKYRSLKLMKNKEIRGLLDWADSTYKANPDMRKQVEQQEEARKKKRELLQQAREKQKEVEKLKRKAGNVTGKLPGSSIRENGF